MALRSKAKLFPTGGEVFVATMKGAAYLFVPMHGTIVHVGKGRIEVDLDQKGHTIMSPNDRHMCLTKSECSRICDILNDMMAKGCQI